MPGPAELIVARMTRCRTVNGQVRVTPGGQGRQLRRSPNTPRGPQDPPGPRWGGQACAGLRRGARGRGLPAGGRRPAPTGPPGLWGIPPCPRRGGIRCRRCRADWGLGSAVGTWVAWSRWTVAVPGDPVPGAGRGQGKSSNFPAQKVPGTVRRVTGRPAPGAAPRPAGGAITAASQRPTPERAGPGPAALATRRANSGSSGTANQP